MVEVPSYENNQVHDRLNDVVLVSDLDGTLCRTDTLHESLLALLTRKPVAFVSLPKWIASGRATLKARVAYEVTLDASTLPLNTDVVEELKRARDQGRRTALVSAADSRHVESVAAISGLFDEAYGSQDGENLKGASKAAFLTARYGEKGFDYIGDSRADIPVWSAARQAITVGASKNLKQSVEAENKNTRHLSPPENRLSYVLQAIRPHQWSKNLLVFLPMLADHNIENLTLVLLTFFAFCLTASASYVINDLLDLASDRAHPRKRNRPFASGNLTTIDGAILALTLLISAILIATFTQNQQVYAVLGTYFIVTQAYSIWLKRKLVIDILVLAGLYTLRVYAGSVAADLVLSPWLLGFSMFLFLSLAAVKRQAELIDQINNQRSVSGRAYQTDDLPVILAVAVSAGQATALVLALYLTSDTVIELYSRPALLWPIVPLLLYWLLRMIFKTHRGKMTDDPIVFASNDSVSLLTAGLIFISLVLSK